MLKGFSSYSVRYNIDGISLKDGALSKPTKILFVIAVVYSRLPQSPIFGIKKKKQHV